MTLPRRIAVLLILTLVACGGEEEPAAPPPAPVVAPEAPGPNPEETSPPADPAADLEREGVDFLRDGKTEEAERCFRAVLERDPDSAVAHRHLAAIHAARGERDLAAAHLRKAATLPRRPPGSPGEMVHGEAYADLAVDLWLAGGGPPGDEALLLTEALAADPDHPRAAMLLSDLALGRGRPEEALRILEDAGRALASDEDGAALLLRLAVRRLAAGDGDGYAEAVRRIPKRTAASRLARRLGEPTGTGAMQVEGWPRHRPETAVFEGIDDLPVFTAAERDPVAAVREGTALAVDRLVARPLGPEVRRVLVWGYLPGLDAFLTDDAGLEEPVVIPAAEVHAGLIRPLAAAEGRESGETGSRAAAALAHLAAGRFGEAWDAASATKDHPLSRYVLATIAIERGAGTSAVEALLGGGEGPPPGLPYRLLYSEALVARGEIGRALEVVDAAAGEYGDLSGLPLVRRTRALLRLTPSDDSETVAALEAILDDFPAYTPAWEDISGLHLSARRYREARETLVRLGRAVPEFTKRPRYVAARAKAAVGIVRTAGKADDLLALDETDDPEVRRAAVRLTPRWPLEDGRRLLLHFLEDPDPAVRILAIRFLGLDGWTGALDPVKALTDDPDEKVRGAALHTYRRIAGRDSALLLVDRLSDRSAYVREVAVMELRNLSGKRLGYEARDPEEKREAAAAKWRAWAESR